MSKEVTHILIGLGVATLAISAVVIFAPKIQSGLGVK